MQQHRHARKWDRKQRRGKQKGQSKHLSSITPENPTRWKCAAATSIEQEVNVCQTTAVRDAWARQHKLSVPGWIYDIQDGLIHDPDLRNGAGTNLTEHSTAARASGGRIRNVPDSLQASKDPVRSP